MLPKPHRNLSVTRAPASTVEQGSSDDDTKNGEEEIEGVEDALQTPLTSPPK